MSLGMKEDSGLVIAGLSGFLLIVLRNQKRRFYQALDSKIGKRVDRPAH
jgi:hypothetical protein